MINHPLFGAARRLFYTIAKRAIKSEGKHQESNNKNQIKLVRRGGFKFQIQSYKFINERGAKKFFGMMQSLLNFIRKQNSKVKNLEQIRASVRKYHPF